MGSEKREQYVMLRKEGGGGRSSGERSENTLRSESARGCIERGGKHEEKRG